MRHLALAALLAGHVVACKTDDAPRPSSPAPAPAPALRAPLAAPADAQEPRPLALAQLRALAPTLPGAPELRPLRLAPSGLASQSWCMPGRDAAAAAASLARALGVAGWTELTTRGDPARAAVGASYDEVRLSITVGGADERCAGVVATATYAGAQLVVPPIEDGERLH